MSQMDLSNVLSCPKQLAKRLIFLVEKRVVRQRLRRYSSNIFQTSTMKFVSRQISRYGGARKTSQKQDLSSVSIQCIVLRKVLRRQLSLSINTIFIIFQYEST